MPMTADLHHVLAILRHETVVVSLPVQILETERLRVLDCLRKRGQSPESLRAEVAPKLQRAIESRMHKDPVHGRQVAGWVATLCVLADAWRSAPTDRGIVIQMIASEGDVVVSCWTVPGQANILAVRTSIESGRS
jgi:hypothetical protein